MEKLYFVAGGTGGHINPALSLGTHFKKKGFQVKYVSGRRHLDYSLYEGEDCIHLNSYALLGKDPVFILKSFIYNFTCLLIMLVEFLQNRPKFVFGTGGYVCGPTLLAAKLLGIKVYILEQNSVMGMTNKLLSNISNIIFTNFDDVIGMPESVKTKVIKSGNPVREGFLRSFKKEEENPKFEILVTGASLGAVKINNLIKDFLVTYDGERELKIIHQTGKNECHITEINSNIDYHQTQYIKKMDEAFFNADLIICRGGATTITELRYVQRPVIIIPLLIHADKHQVKNAEGLKSEVIFPVYCHSEDELNANSCEKLNSIIKEVQTLKLKTNYQIPKNPLLKIEQEIN